MSKRGIGSHAPEAASKELAGPRAVPVLVALALLPGGSALAQPGAPPPQDPLISLMLSQPKVNITNEVRAIAAFDPALVRPGDRTFYRVSFNALEESIEWPADIKTPAGIELRPGAHGQILQMSSANLMPVSSFNSRVRAAGVGEFTIPEFTVKVYGKPVVVPAARLTVVSSLPAEAVAPQPLLLELAATNLYVGQPINARVLLPGSPAGLTQVQLVGEGFLVDQGSVRQRGEAGMRFGTNYAAFIYDVILTPMTAGKLSVFAQGFTAGIRFTGPIVINGAATALPLYALLESDPVPFHARPLPREGELPGFTGTIANLQLEPPRLSTNIVRVGDTVNLTVTVRGETNLARLVPPPPPHSRDWQVFATEGPAPPLAAQQVGARFSYTLIPLTEEAQATPPIPFSCFDPIRARYVDLTIPPVPITVQPGAAPADARTLLAAARTGTNAEPEAMLKPLAESPGRAAVSLIPVQMRAWFPLAQIAPAAGIFGLWAWDRRRRYLDQHAEVVLRRRARRALRREVRVLKSAARAGDAPRFAAVAVNAMRVACAPHFPAEPRALVGRDVLEVLRGHGAAGGNGRAGEVVRRFFEVADAAAFGPQTANATGLLLLQPELERVLQELEERL